MNNKAIMPNVKLTFNSIKNDIFELNFPNKKEITSSDLFDAYLTIEGFLAKQSDTIVSDGKIIEVRTAKPLKEFV